MTWDEVATHLNGLANLATVRADGRPNVAVVAPVVDGEVLWVFTRRHSAKARAISTSPDVALMWRPGVEAYLWGTATIVDELAEKERLWNTQGLPFDPVDFFGRPDDPGFVLLRIVPANATVLGREGRRTWRRSTG